MRSLGQEAKLRGNIHKLKQRDFNHTVSKQTIKNANRAIKKRARTALKRQLAEIEGESYYGW